MSNYSALILGTAGLLYYNRLGSTNPQDQSTFNRGVSWNFSTSGSLVAGAITSDTDSALSTGGTYGSSPTFYGYADIGFAGPQYTDFPNFTIECWVKIAAGQGGCVACLGNGMPSFYVVANSNTLQLYRSGQAALTASNGTVSLNRWVHVAVVCTAGNYSYYIDGTPYAGGSGAGTYQFSGQFWIGQDRGGSQYAGAIDELAIYNRALSQSEIQQRVTTASTPPTYVPANPQPTPATFVGREKIAPLFKTAMTERVALVGIGNSNWQHSGNGWLAGLKAALSKRYGLWGDGPVPFNGGVANANTPAGLKTPLLDPGDGNATFIGEFYDAGGSPPSQFEASYFFNTTNGGDATQYFDGRDGFKLTTHYGTFPSGSGKLTPVIGVNGNHGIDAYGGPVNYAAKGATVSTNTGSYGLAQHVLTMQPDVTRYTQSSYQYNAYADPAVSSGDTVGPNLLAYLQFEQPARTKGFAVSTMTARGGNPLRSLLYDIAQASDAALTYYLTAVRAPLGASKAVLVVIQEAQNSRNGSSKPPHSGGDTPAEYAANLQAIVDRVRAIYALNGWSTASLYFVSMGDHAIADPEDAQDAAFRAITATVVAPANPRFGAVDLSQILTGTEMTAAAYYAASNTDPAHLREDGTAYTKIATKIIDGFSPTPASGSVYPSPADVRLGQHYGLQGDDVTGTAVFGLTDEQQDQLALVATEIVKVPRAGSTHRYSRTGVLPVNVAITEVT